MQHKVELQREKCNFLVFHNLKFNKQRDETIKKWQKNKYGINKQKSLHQPFKVWEDCKPKTNYFLRRFGAEYLYLDKPFWICLYASVRLLLIVLPRKTSSVWVPYKKRARFLKADRLPRVRRNQQYQAAATSYSAAWSDLGWQSESVWPDQIHLV